MNKVIKFISKPNSIIHLYESKLSSLSSIAGSFIVLETILKYTFGNRINLRRNSLLLNSTEIEEDIEHRNSLIVEDRIKVEYKGEVSNIIKWVDLANELKTNNKFPMLNREELIYQTIWLGWIRDDLIPLISLNLNNSLSSTLSSHHIAGYSKLHALNSYAQTRLLFSNHAKVLGYEINSRWPIKWHLYRCLGDWTKGLNYQSGFSSSLGPAIADYSIFGLLQNLNRFQLGKEIMARTDIYDFYIRMQNFLENDLGLKK